MELEVQVAVDFITSFVAKTLSRTKADAFRICLKKAITTRFRGHWYPDRPSKGSGFRCISISNHCDQVLFTAAKQAEIDGRLLKDNLPKHLDLWIDPGEVAYRIGEHGSVKVIYKQDDGNSSRSAHSRPAVGRSSSAPIQLAVHSRASEDRKGDVPTKQLLPGGKTSPPPITNKRQKENRLSPTAKSFSSRRSPSPFPCPPTSTGLLQSPIIARSDYQGKAYWASAYDPLGLSSHNYLLAQELALYEAQRIALQSQYYKSSYFQWLRNQSTPQYHHSVAGQQATAASPQHQRHPQLPILA